MTYSERGAQRKTGRLSDQQYNRQYITGNIQVE